MKPGRPDARRLAKRPRLDRGSGPGLLEPTRHDPVVAEPRVLPMRDAAAKHDEMGNTADLIGLGESGALQAPQRPVWARRETGMRLLR